METTEIYSHTFLKKIRESNVPVKEITRVDLTKFFSVSCAYACMIKCEKKFREVFSNFSSKNVDLTEKLIFP